MLDPDFYRRYRVLPTPWFFQSSYQFYRAWVAATRTRVVAENFDRLDARPMIIATNSTQNQDFMAIRLLAGQRNVKMVTVTKAKNYHSRIMAFALERLGVVPIASKGYFILVDAIATLGRRPTDAQYRALRDHLERDTAIDDAELAPVLHRARPIFGRAFDPQQTSWRALVRSIYQDSLSETVRLSGEAVQAGHHVQMYPEGTVSRRLGRGRNGAVQLAHALDLAILPVGMSGCPEAFIGTSPMVRGGEIRLRVGEPIALPKGLLPSDFRPFDPVHEAAHQASLQRVTDEVMGQLNALVDPPYRRADGEVGPGKGTRAHF